MFPSRARRLVAEIATARSAGFNESNHVSTSSDNTTSHTTYELYHRTPGSAHLTGADGNAVLIEELPASERVRRLIGVIQAAG
jgi:hypothetical protein